MVDRDGWIACGAGAALALVALALPFVSFVLSTFVTLVHEMGHALAGWLYGYPSLPAFDFAYGGGVTLHGERIALVPFAVAALLAAAAFALHRIPAALALALGALALYAATAWTAAHDAVIVAMGHGGELLFAGIFLYRAFSGNACERPGERPLYALTGSFVVFHDLRFAWRLWASPLERELYAEAKGGGHWMDFSRLAHEHLGTSVEAVAAAFALLCLLPPIAALAACHFSKEGSLQGR
jgi:hypothetical protein